jgi:hypothetical protein
MGTAKDPLTGKMPSCPDKGTVEGPLTGRPVDRSRVDNQRDYLHPMHQFHPHRTPTGPISHHSPRFGSGSRTRHVNGMAKCGWRRFANGLGSRSLLIIIIFTTLSEKVKSLGRFASVDRDSVDRLGTSPNGLHQKDVLRFRFPRNEILILPY